MKIKIITSFLALVLVVSLAVGCGNGGGGAAVADAPAQQQAAADNGGAVDADPAEPVARELVRWLYPGSPGINHDTITDYINDMLERDGMNIEFQAIPIGWDIWEQRVNLMFQTGEEFEFVHVPEGFGPGFVQLWNMGASIRLNEYLEAYAPTIKSVVPEWLWSAATIGDSIATIPAFWVETAHLQGGISLRRDLYERFGMELPTNLDELVERSIELQQHMIEAQMYPRTPFVYMRFQEIQPFPHRTYPTYPFTVIDQILLVRQDGTVEAWVDSEEFRWDSEFYNRLFEAGLIHPELLSADVVELAAEFDIGNYLFSEWNTATGDQWMRDNAGDDSIENIYIIFNYPEVPIMRSQGVRNSNIVSSTSPNPSAAVRFHEWFYANEDAYWAMQWGIEGLNYTILDNGDIDMIPGQPHLGIAGWMIANINLQPSWSFESPDWVRLTRNEDLDAINCISIGFSFDPSPVNTQFANVLAEVPTVIFPMRAGIISWEDGHAAASAAMRAAGIDDVVAEYQRQLLEWLATQ